MLSEKKNHLILIALAVLVVVLIGGVLFSENIIMEAQQQMSLPLTRMEKIENILGFLDSDDFNRVLMRSTFRGEGEMHVKVFIHKKTGELGLAEEARRLFNPDELAEEFVEGRIIVGSGGKIKDIIVPNIKTLGGAAKVNLSDALTIARSPSFYRVHKELYSDINTYIYHMRRYQNEYPNFKILSSEDIDNLLEKKHKLRALRDRIDRTLLGSEKEARLVRMLKELEQEVQDIRIKNQMRLAKVTGKGPEIKTSLPRLGVDEDFLRQRELLRKSGKEASEEMGEKACNSLLGKFLKKCLKWGPGIVVGGITQCVDASMTDAMEEYANTIKHAEVSLQENPPFVDVGELKQEYINIILDMEDVFIGTGELAEPMLNALRTRLEINKHKAKNKGNKEWLQRLEEAQKQIGILLFYKADELEELIGANGLPAHRIRDYGCSFVGEEECQRFYDQWQPTRREIVSDKNMTPEELLELLNPDTFLTPDIPWWKQGFSN